MTVVYFLWFISLCLAGWLFYELGLVRGRKKEISHQVNQLLEAAALKPLPRHPGVHDCGGLWGRWEFRTVTRYVDGEFPKPCDIQQRTCEGCGFTERKKVLS